MLIMNKIMIFLTSFTTVKVDEKKKLKKNNYSSMKGIQDPSVKNYHHYKRITRSSQLDFPLIYRRIDETLLIF